MPQIRVVRGPEPGRIFELTDDVVTIGRGRKNTIIIHDNEISREHCRLVRVLFDYEIVDLKSTNGTFLNGRPVGETSTLLFNKNIIELGDSIVLEYLTTPDSSIFTPPPGVLLAETESEQASDANKAAAGNFYLVVRRRSQFMPEVYLLDTPLVDIGRHFDNAICLSENQVSRFHMRLNRTSDGYVLEDLGSTNGTMVNGTRVKEPVILTPGDYITIGHMVEMWFTDNFETLRMVPSAARPNQQLPATSKLPDVGDKPAPTSPPASGMPSTTMLDPSKLSALMVDALKVAAAAQEDVSEETENFPPQLHVPPSDSAKQPIRGLPSPDASSPAVFISSKRSAASSDEIAKATKATEESPDVSNKTNPPQAERDSSAEP
jgi:pSer/pThr/pTyr-binding forkhead associated (FHA) protein